MNTNSYVLICKYLVMYFCLMNFNSNENNQYSARIHRALKWKAHHDINYMIEHLYAMQKCRLVIWDEWQRWICDVDTQIEIVDILHTKSALEFIFEKNINAEWLFCKHMLCTFVMSPLINPKWTQIRSAITVTGQQLASSENSRSWSMTERKSVSGIGSVACPTHKAIPIVRSKKCLEMRCLSVGHVPVHG